MCLFLIPAAVTAMGGMASAVTASVALAGAAASAYGTVQQGKQAEAEGQYNAKIMENNAKTAQAAAEDAQQRGAIAEDAQRNRTRQVLGAQRAAMAANGGDLTDQSSINVLSDTARFGELDALTVRSNAAREAWGFENQASDYSAQAVGSQFRGKGARQAGNIGAVGTMLSSAGNTASRMKIA